MNYVGSDAATKIIIPFGDGVMLTMNPITKKMLADAQSGCADLADALLKGELSAIAELAPIDSIFRLVERTAEWSEQAMSVLWPIELAREAKAIVVEVDAKSNSSRKSIADRKALAGLFRDPARLVRYQFVVGTHIEKLLNETGNCK